MQMINEKNDRVLLQEKLENMVTCPITGEIFKEPVMTNSGKTYEGEYIREWMTKNKYDPLTGKEIKNLRPHLLMERLVKELPLILEELKNGIFRKLSSILWCPVAGSFEYPVVTIDGYTYELKSIPKLPQCLYTLNPVKKIDLVKDYAIYDLISFLKQRASFDYSIINFIKFNQTFELFFIKLSMGSDRKDLYALMLTCMSFYKVIKEYFTPYDIHIKTFTLRTFGLSVCAMDTAEDLAEKVMKTQHITVSNNENSFFCFVGKRLQDRVPLVDIHVQKEATIWLVNKMRGD